MEKTPKFMQIVAAGTGGSSMMGGEDYLFGLTSGGDVYQWTKVEEEGIWKSRWVKLENQE